MKMLLQLDKPIILSYQHLAPNSDASICKTTILPLMQNGLSTVSSLSRKRWKLMTNIQNQVKQKGKRRIWVKFWKLKAMGVNGMRQVEEGGKAKHRYKSGPMSRIFVILLERGPIESLKMNSDGHFFVWIGGLLGDLHYEFDPRGLRQWINQWQSRFTFRPLDSVDSTFIPTSPPCLLCLTWEIQWLTVGKIIAALLKTFILNIFRI